METITTNFDISPAGGEMSGKASQANNNNNNNSNRQSRRRPSRRQRRRGRMRTRRAPVNTGMTMNTGASLRQRNGKTQLITREMFPIHYHPSQMFDFALPFTPTKWAGTRSAILTSTYTSFRPKSVLLHYQPCVATTQAGTISMGTCFDGASIAFTDRQAAITALPSTNAGINTAIWSKVTRGVSLSTALRANTFPTSNVNEDDIPFWILISCASNLNDGDLIGNLTIESRIFLHNPITRANPSIAANNIPATITHVANPPSTSLSIAKSLVPQVLAIGKDYFLAANSNLKNLQDNVITRAISYFTGQLINDNDDTYTMVLDSNFASAAPYVTLLGSATENF